MIGQLVVTKWLPKGTSVVTMLAPRNGQAFLLLTAAPISYLLLLLFCHFSAFFLHVDVHDNASQLSQY